MQTKQIPSQMEKFAKSVKHRFVNTRNNSNLITIFCTESIVRNSSMIPHSVSATERLLSMQWGWPGAY